MFRALLILLLAVTPGQGRGDTKELVAAGGQKSLRQRQADLRRAAQRAGLVPE